MVEHHPCADSIDDTAIPTLPAPFLVPDDLVSSEALYSELELYPAWPDFRSSPS